MLFLRESLNCQDFKYQLINICISLVHHGVSVCKLCLEVSKVRSERRLVRSCAWETAQLGKSFSKSLLDFEDRRGALFMS